MRNRLDQELRELSNQLIEMGAQVENAIESAVDALLRRDLAMARKAIEFDGEVDDKEMEIQRRCLRLLLQQQPVAADLRLISSALRMISDMERIGDQAADIAEITLTMSQDFQIGALEAIPAMAKATIRMVRDSVDAFVARDLELARRVIQADDRVDALFLDARGELLEIIQAHHEWGAEAMDLLMVVKYLERIGDHATNIAEWVELAITGVHKNHSVF